MVALFTTPLLSQKPFVAPSNGIPIILSLYRSASFISHPTRSATNSEPKVDASTVACRLLYQMMMLVWERRVIGSPAKAASISRVISTVFYIDSYTFVDISSMKSP